LVGKGKGQKAEGKDEIQKAESVKLKAVRKTL